MKKLTKSERSWVMYDWANSVHSTVISTAIFPLWFGQVARGGGLSETQTSFWLGTANTGYAVIIALMAAVLGTLSDFKGFRKMLFTPFWLLGVIATGALVLVGAEAWVFALVLYILTFIGFAGANIFYDASLPDITTPGRMDMVSSMGFGYGYIGGSTIPFLISLGIIAVLSGMNFSGGLPTLGVKISFALTALWWFVFTFPFLKNVKQKNGIDPVPSPVAESFRRLGRTFLEIREHKKVFIFLIAYFFYIDGVNTIIKMATNFASSIGVGMMVLLAAIVGIQILAFPFALLYGRLAGRFGARSLLFVGIGVYTIITVLGTVMPLVPLGAVMPIFIAVAFLVATSQGGIQALSRSYFASIIPDSNSSGEFFGFYNTMGKFAAIIGPFLMGAL
ncbi:MAG: MFS transporter, partial [Spirochaetaceae bacterium]|nr:MFS transporter [Spirochaetaceae bacterium]